MTSVSGPVPGERPDHEPSSDEQAQDPGSSHPTAGAPHLDDEDRAEALEEMPRGNATVGDMVDSDAVDSRAHEVPEDGPA